ncbi:MAG: TlpA disulfide reductase family protein [Myxococcota bacterium]|nr:TlpA disulfide reductase family protein [Myxococcota bacterium]
MIGTVLLAGLSVACEETPPPSNEPRDPAPDFALARLGVGSQARPVALADYAGKTVVLDFWATWCVPCEFQVPELNAFYDAHRSDSDVALFGVSVDTASPDIVESWVAEKAVRYPILLDGEATALEYDLEGYPTVVIVRPDGTIDSRHAGLIQQSELEEVIQRIRSETRAPAS